MKDKIKKLGKLSCRMSDNICKSYIWLLRVPWTARRSNQSILKQISPGCSLEGLMLKLKLQYFGHLMRRADSVEKTLMLGKTEVRRRRGNRGWDGWMASSTQWAWVWMDSGSWWLTGRPGMPRFMGSQRVGHDWATELNWIMNIVTKTGLFINKSLVIKYLLVTRGKGTGHNFWKNDSPLHHSGMT